QAFRILRRISIRSGIDDAVLLDHPHAAGAKSVQLQRLVQLLPRKQRGELLCGARHVRELLVPVVLEKAGRGQGLDQRRQRGVAINSWSVDGIGAAAHGAHGTPIGRIYAVASAAAPWNASRYGVMSILG